MIITVHGYYESIYCSECQKSIQNATRVMIAKHNIFFCGDCYCLFLTEIDAILREA